MFIFTKLKEKYEAFKSKREEKNKNKKTNDNLEYTSYNYNYTNNDDDDTNYYYQQGSDFGVKVAGGVINECGEFVSAPMPPSFDNYDWGGYADVNDRNSFY